MNTSVAAPHCHNILPSSDVHLMVEKGTLHYQHHLFTLFYSTVFLFPPPFSPLVTARLSCLVAVLIVYRCVIQVGQLGHDPSSSQHCSLKENRGLETGNSGRPSFLFPNTQNHNQPRLCFLELRRLIYPLILTVTQGLCRIKEQCSVGGTAR